MKDTSHQGRRRADRPRGGDDPHVGAALRLPRAGAHVGRLPPVLATGTSRRCAASSPTAIAGCRSGARSSAPAPDGPPTTRRSTPRSRRRAAARPQVLRKRTLIAISAARSSTRRSPTPRRRWCSPPSSSERFYRAVEQRYRRLAARPTRATCSRTSTPWRAATARRPRSRSHRRRAGQRVGGGRRRAGLRRVPAGLGAAARDRAGARPRCAGSRRSGPSTPRRAARGEVGGGWPAARRRSTGRASRTARPRPLALEQPAPALTALTNRLVGYLEG